jgi:hypothetical protein
MEGDRGGQSSLEHLVRAEEKRAVNHRARWLKSGDGGFETFCTLELSQARASSNKSETAIRSGLPSV